VLRGGDGGLGRRSDRYRHIFSTDVDRARHLASRIQAGRVGINGAREPLSPFGGFKQSGIGREGLEAFLEPRAVVG
jgi:aldehyde dehydrogenase (NAD+)